MKLPWLQNLSLPLLVCGNYPQTLNAAEEVLVAPEVTICPTIAPMFTDVLFPGFVSCIILLAFIFIHIQHVNICTCTHFFHVSYSYSCRTSAYSCLLKRPPSCINPSNWSNWNWSVRLPQKTVLNKLRCQFKCALITSVLYPAVFGPVRCSSNTRKSLNLGRFLDCHIPQNDKPAKFQNI